MKLKLSISNIAAKAAIAWALGAVLFAQTPAPQASLMSEKAFHNVKVLTGIPVDQFMATMGFFSASLGENCTFCHVQESGGDWDKYADDNENKVKARKMIAMVAGLNKTYFEGRRVVTCYSCHRAGDRPIITPSLIELYGPPPPTREPDVMADAESKPAAVDKILDKYLQALGGPDHLAKLTSFTAKGTAQAFAEISKHPFEVFAKAPAQRSIVTHTPTGDTSTTYDGHSAWLIAPKSDRPFPLIDYTGNDLQGAKLDATLAFPGQIKQLLTQWRVGNPAEIDDKEVQFVQGTMDGKNPVNLYFDPETGLLVRTVRFTNSPVGLNPTQVDYSDYREVAGVKVPFKWTVSWLDGRVIVELSEVRPNVAIEASRFAKPAK